MRKANAALSSAVMPIGASPLTSIVSFTDMLSRFNSTSVAALALVAAVTEWISTGRVEPVDGPGGATWWAIPADVIFSDEVQIP